MNRYIVAALCAALLALSVGAATSEARGCHSFACVNKKLKQLKKQNQRLQNEVRSLQTNVFGCEGLVGVTSYGDFDSGSYGYVYDDGFGSQFLTSALDYADTNDPDFWMVVDDCGPAKSGLGKVSPPTGGEQR